MRIAHSGLQLTDGKVKYDDALFSALVDKFKPAKTVAYTFEFIGEDFDNAQAIAMARENLLDLLILDMDKIETRLERTDVDSERTLLQKCLGALEEQVPVCDIPFNPGEQEAVRAFGLLSNKPTVLFDAPPSDPLRVCAAAMEKAGQMFFFTVGKPEVHAWMVPLNATAVTCAGRIHSDLARGFIKAEIFKSEDILELHGVQEARTKGLMQLVDRDFPVPANSIVEIRFNV